MRGFLKKRVIIVIFLIAVCILLFSSILVYRQVARLMAANAWVIHTHQIIEKNSKTLLDVIDSERIEDNYLVTKDPALLVEYDKDMENAYAMGEKLQTLLADSPVQLQALNELPPLIHQHDKISRNAMQSFRFTGKHVVPTQQSITSDIKKIINSMNQTEYFLLKQRTDEATQDAHQTFLMVVIFGKIGGVLLLLSFLLLNYQEKRHNSEQMKINQELEKQNKRALEATRLKSEFLANMSHELRTPLNAIIGFSELMQDREVGPISKEQDEFLSDILSSARHLLQLINDILDLSKVEAGKMEFRPEKIDLPKIVNEVVELMHPLASQKHIYITTAIDKELHNVFIDPARFKQILYNYLSNAIKFTKDTGTVSINMRQESNNQFCLEVADNGIGITPGDLKKLFVEFQQLDASAAKKYAGTGLGLALTKHLVEAQGGAVGVTSQVGVGSTFSAVLPRDYTTVVETQMFREWVPKSDVKFTVLMIEDGQSDLKWIQNVLTTSHCNLEMARTGAHAIAYCEGQRFDLIVLDLMIPDMNGYDVLKQIRLTGNENTPVVIIVSSNAQKNHRMVLISDNLVLPIEKDNFIQMLQRIGLIDTKIQRIVIIDDDKASLKMTSKILKPEKYEVISVDNARAGLDVVLSQKPDLIILDLGMPEMNGFEFLRFIRHDESIKNTHIIIWTARDLTAEENVILQTSVQGVVQKSRPNSAMCLLEEVKKALALNKQSAEK